MIALKNNLEGGDSKRTRLSVVPYRNDNNPFFYIYDNANNLVKTGRCVCCAPLTPELNLVHSRVDPKKVTSGPYPYSSVCTHEGLVVYTSEHT